MLRTTIKRCDGVTVKVFALVWVQVAALRVLAGLLEASAEGMDAFRVRDGFNVLYHALAQEDDGDHAPQQARQAQQTCSIQYHGNIPQER